ncbi:MAG: hypothetical protein JW920_12215 [Deltaproteobacteria bacterium]|nr:hypothetical protein [Deltaproteobacteria bacterium]
MKKNITVIPAALMVIVLTITWSISTAHSTEEQDPSPVCAPSNKPSQDFIPPDENRDNSITLKLEELGLYTGKVEKLADDVFRVDIDDFEEQSQALSRETRFRPCSLMIKVEKGKVLLERCSLEDAGFQTDKKLLPPSIDIEEDKIWGRP